MTVQIIVSKDIDLDDEDMAIYLNEGILDYAAKNYWIIDNISMI